MERRVRWGQNFLVDRSVAEHIVEWAQVDGATVLEIGPGRGCLSGLLAERAGRLVLVEIDRRLVARLRERFAEHPNVEIVEGDALLVDLEHLAGGDRVAVVANLPYESGTAILLRLLDSGLAIDSMTVMLQREVCRRILAEPGQREWGRLAMAVRLRAEVQAGRTVAPSSFRPPPKVHSRLIRLSPLDGLRFDVGSLATFEAMARSAFSSPRKMVRNTLFPWLCERVGEQRAHRLAQAAGIEPTQRPHTIALERFASLSRSIGETEGVAAGA